MNLDLKLNELKNKGKDWFVEKAEGTHTKFWLATLSFSESIFFPIPSDALLIAILLSKAKRWIYFAFFTAFFSVLGAVVGYFIGFYFFDLIGENIISFYGLKNEFLKVADMFSQNSFWVMFVSAFTPIPYKVFVLTGGFFKINFLSFFIASLMGRLLRFLFVSFVIQRFREKIAYAIFKYFNILTYTSVLLILIYFFYKTLF